VAPALLPSRNGLQCICADGRSPSPLPKEALDAAANQIEEMVRSGKKQPTGSKPIKPSNAPSSEPIKVNVAIWGLPWGIFFYSAFFTSVWLWLYALAGGLVKFGHYADIGIRGFKKTFDVENKPLRSLGFVSNVAITLVYVVMPVVR